MTPTPTPRGPRNNHSSSQLYTLSRQQSAEPSPVSGQLRRPQTPSPVCYPSGPRKLRFLPQFPEPAAPQASLNPQLPGKTSPGSPLSYALRIRAGYTSPLPPRTPLSRPNPSLRQGGGEGKALRGWTETREAKRPPQQAPPGPLGSAALHCPPGPAGLMPKSRATRAQGSALTREGK